MNPQAHLVYLAWQCPATRAILPVGRLVKHARNDYEFAYIRAVRRAQELGFEALVSFPDLNATYRSADLPPLFHNRVMRSSRPDYPAFVAELGLATDAGPLPQMARSGGRRTTDELEVFAPPARLPDGRWETDILIRGVRHVPHAEDAVSKLAVGDRLLVMTDFQKEQGAEALVLRTIQQEFVGYLPAYLARELAGQSSEIAQALAVTVAKINPHPANVHHRLLCRVEFPPEISLFSSDEYLPLVANGSVAAE